MRVIARLFFAAAFFALIFSAGCGVDIKVDSKCLDESYDGGPVKSALVIGMMGDKPTKELYESILATRLIEKKVRAAAGFEALPPDSKISAEAARAKAAELGAQAVIVLRLASEQEPCSGEITAPFEQCIAPIPFDDYLTEKVAMGIDTGIYQRRISVRLQASVYDSVTKKHIWTGRTNTIDPVKAYGLADDLCDVIIKGLKKDKIISRK